jgi:hypothetical protein
VDAVSKQKSGGYWVRCGRRLPHEQHFDLMRASHAETDRPSGLRVENVLYGNMMALTPTHRNGRCVVHGSVSPLLNPCSDMYMTKLSCQSPTHWESLPCGRD